MALYYLGGGIHGSKGWRQKSGREGKEGGRGGGRGGGGGGARRREVKK